MSKRKATYARKAPYAKKQRVTKVYRSLSEKKNIDNNLSNMIVAAQTIASVQLINGVAEGASSILRIGRRTTMTSLEIRFPMSAAPAAGAGTSIRLVVLYDRQANAAFLTTTDAVQVDNIAGLMNLANARRFRVIAEEIVESIGSYSNGAGYIKRYVDFTNGGKKAGLPVEYNQANTGTITSITSGALYALVWQNGLLITTNPNSLLYTRVRFSDC